MSGFLVSPGTVRGGSHSVVIWQVPLFIIRPKQLFSYRPPPLLCAFQVGERALQQIPLQQLGSWHEAESVTLETPAPSPRLSWALPSCPGACFEDSVHSFFREVLSLPTGPVPTDARATVVLQTDSLRERCMRLLGRRTFLVLSAHLWPFSLLWLWWV